MDEKTKKAKLRAEVIVKVRSGLITATEGAKILGVSRKTYYEYEKRGLTQMMEALTEKPSGRKPRKVDEEKEKMKKEIEDLKAEISLLHTRDRVREVMEADITSLLETKSKKRDTSEKER